MLCNKGILILYSKSENLNYTALKTSLLANMILNFFMLQKYAHWHIIKNVSKKCYYTAMKFRKYNSLFEYQQRNIVESYNQAVNTDYSTLLNCLDLYHFPKKHAILTKENSNETETPPMNYFTWEGWWWPSWPCWSRESVSTWNGTWKTTSPSITRWKCCSWASSWGTSFTFPRHLARLCGCNGKAKV